MENESQAQGFSELFVCNVQGTDITECRFNAWNALDSFRGVLPRDEWKVLSMQHVPNPEYSPEIPENGLPLHCQAVFSWVPGGTRTEAEEILPVISDGSGN